MKRAVSLVDEANTFDDDVIVRKIIECRRGLRVLSTFRGEEVKSACAQLQLAIESLKAEAEERSLPVESTGTFSKTSSKPTQRDSGGSGAFG